MKKNQKLNAKGITLVALVVTIIVLLILAGVSINLVFDANGLFSKANDAASKYNQAKNDEVDFLSNAMNMMNTYIDKYGDKSDDRPFMTENTKVYENGEDGDYYWIPEGFREKIPDSAPTIKEGKVVEDRKGNEFVWIPAYVPGGEISSQECATELKATTFDESLYDLGDDDSPDFYKETVDQNDINSVKEFGGYLQGRFEAGKDSAENVIVKKGILPYVSIMMDDIIAKSKGFVTANSLNGQSMYSKLVSGYAWDCSLAFIAKSYPNYLTNSGGEYGIYEVTNLTLTGSKKPVCNIYDMGGNVWERTSEMWDDFEYVGRGGCFSWKSTERPAAYREHYDDDMPYNNYGFRVTLYLKMNNKS